LYNAGTAPTGLGLRDMAAFMIGGPVGWGINYAAEQIAKGGVSVPSLGSMIRT